MTNTQSDDRDNLLADIDYVRKNLGKALDSIAGAAATVAKLQGSGDPRLIESLLSVQSSLSVDDVRLLGTVAKVLDDRGKLPNGLGSLEGLRALATASPDLQAEAIRVGGAGHLIGKTAIERMQFFRKWSDLGDDAVEAEARRACLDAFAAVASSAAIQRLEAATGQLSDQIWEFMNYFWPEEPDEREIRAKTNPQYNEWHERVAENARAVLSEFERILSGSDEAFAARAESPHARKLKKSHDALKRFASGRFGHPYGFSLKEDNRDPFAVDLAEALDYLSSPLPVTPDRAKPWSRATRFATVEFEAGCGGMALGLTSAGFVHEVLYEPILKRVKTLQANWPQWNAERKSLAAVSDEELRKLRGTVLFAGTIPRMPFARNLRSDDGNHREDDLLPDVSRALSIIRPLAFLLGAPRSIGFKPHVAHLAKACLQLGDLGYRVEVVRLRLEDFGLPQTGERLAIVGLRNDVKGTFIPPVLAKPVHRSVVDALGDLVIVKQTPEHLRDTVRHKSTQYWYDTWADFWREAHKDSLLGTIPVSTEVADSIRTTLRNSGFDGHGIADGPPTLEDIKEDRHYKPQLTVQMVARAQGFPDPWTYRAARGGNIDMIAESFPPVLAKAIGLQIHAALTGVTVDLDRELAEPFVDERMIGVMPKRIGDLRLPFEVRQKAGTYQRIRQIDAAIRFAAKAISVNPEREESEFEWLVEQLRGRAKDRVTDPVKAKLREVLHRVLDYQPEMYGGEYSKDDPPGLNHAS